jgi:multiple antibiotic resistance protein
MESMLQIALTFFLVTNPIGNSPVILTLVKNFPFERQKQIMLREGLIALVLALSFQYIGEHLLDLLNIKSYAVTLCGGTLLFLVALEMIFSLPEAEETASLKQEPFIVPIATPLLSGAGLLSVIMLKSHEVQNNLIVTGALLVSWVGVLGVLWTAPYLQRLLGKQRLLALEQLMGLVLAMIAVNMFVQGAQLFWENL